VPAPFAQLVPAPFQWDFASVEMVTLGSTLSRIQLGIGLVGADKSATRH
jgi:hypothetical protein